MLFAQISPQAEIITQINPFSSITTNCEYMGVLARPYVLGTESVNFELQFGNIVFTGMMDPTSFIYVRSSNIVLSGNQLTNWGIDDTYIIEEIAGILGISVLSYVEISLPGYV
jgi:hypothetical protein